MFVYSVPWNSCLCHDCVQDVTAGWSTPQRWTERRPCGRWTAAWFQLNGTTTFGFKKLWRVTTEKILKPSTCFFVTLQGIAGCIVSQKTPPPRIHRSPGSSWLRSTSSTWAAARSSTCPTRPPARRSTSGFHPKPELSELWVHFVVNYGFLPLYPTCPE